MISLKTQIPGPKSIEILNRRANALPSGSAKATDIVVHSAQDAVVTDVDGNVLLDFAGGIGMLNLGHRPKAVIDAVKNQLDHYVHSCNIVTTIEPYVALAEMLNSLCPGDFLKKTLVANSGTEAVENAVNIAKYHTGRNAVICFEGAYHGRSTLTLSLTSKYGLFKRGFGSFVSDIYRLPFPNIYRRPEQMTEDEFIDYSISQLHNALITQVDPSAVAAIIIEPVLGEGGFIPVPKKFLEALRTICDTHGIVFIADEIQAGAGRTGKFLSIEHSGVVPDLVCMAKSIGSGFQISAVTGKAEIMDKPHLGGLGGTYGGSPVACVAAIETIKQLTSKDFLNKATQMGEVISSTLNNWATKYEKIGDVRGIGAMQIIEFVKDKNTKEPDPDFTLAVIKEAVANGVILIRAGVYSNCIRLLPPIVMTNEQLVEGLQVIQNAIKKLS
ncbi:4-aminobutyrate--2-oxoglutarate transaminase [Pedobacter yonginense]|uniref:4-aminobutyrate--2-oxoglutarate transaminase n=1 Tax=Pedobacter yonginense TaxID=651869 RepID=A0A317EVS4_9SPHI|nr:aspartate aminotransferase family protein [Pedobacter yonginense]PWS29326.1 4-aminobutyrate--2-oxoglutarate transaminase [Pedobacter yonginense]